MDLNLRRVHIPVHILRLFDRSGSENIRLPVPLRGRVFDPCPSTLQQLIVQGRAQNFSLGPRPKSRKSRPNTKLVGAVLGEGAASLGVSGSAVSSPSGVQGGAPTAQRFPLFSALGMASSDTTILLTVDDHAAIGGKTPVPPCVRPCNCVLRKSHTAISAEW